MPTPASAPGALPVSPLAAESDSASALALAVELGQLAVWRSDLVAQRVYPNAHAWDVLGLPPSESGLSAAEMRTLIHPDDLPRLSADTELLLQGQGPTTSEARYRRPDGSWRHVLMRRAVQRDADGQPRLLFGVGMDISDRVQQRQRADEMVRRFDLIARTAGIGYWKLEEKAERAVWSDELRCMFGLAADAPVPLFDEWLDQHVHPDDRDELRRGAANWTTGSAETKVTSFRALQRDGSVRHLLTRWRVDAESRPRLLFGVVIDVTERRNAEQALRTAAERIALATRSTGLATWERDVESGDEHWDAQMWLLRGMPPQPRAMTTAERLAMVHPDDRGWMQELYELPMPERGPREHEFRIVRPDGEVRWLASRSRDLTDENSGARKRIGINWDVTDTRNADNARREREIAQRESQAKSKFLARMSHELRTPLNAVLGFSQLLLAEELGDDPAAASRRRRLDHIRSAGQHLLTLINDVLDLSSLEGGELQIAARPVALAPLVEQTLTLLGPLIEADARSRPRDGSVGGDGEERRVTVHTGALDISVMADPTRLRQVLLNLLSNAVKYNRDGGRVHVEALARGEHVLLRVSDTGRGMSGPQLQHLFEPFNRLGLQREGSEAIEGTGIGLAIVKALVEHMGGSVHVDSTVGVGSVFELRLLPATAQATVAPPAAPQRPAQAPVPPARPAGAAPVAPPPPASAAGADGEAKRKLVLYIEDNPINALIISELIDRRSDSTLQVAVDGSSGVAQAASLLPDLILLDMQLPDFDGFEVLRRLRALPATASIPVIALSANAMPDDIRRALRAGMADYWTKPLDFKAFMASLDARFGARSVGHQAPAGLAPPISGRF